MGAGEEELEGAEPQRRQQRRVDLLRLAVGEHGDEVIGGAAALHRSVCEVLRLGALAALDAVALDG